MIRLNIKEAVRCLKLLFSIFIMYREIWTSENYLVFLKAPNKILEDVNIRNWKDNWKVAYYIINKEINIYLI